ncbi:MAG: hypothetical protein EBS05_04290 [Proteobacteria bacterium]|jgi:YbbR domain-containing protein|nr:hypothetical protein [Pseudomonadota bacterium]
MSARDAILQNFWLKFFSFVLATMIWFAISGTPLGTMTRKIERVPITVMKSANDPRAFHVEPSHVDVTVRGPIAEVQALTAKQLEVFINLSDVHDTAGLKKQILVHTPAGIAVVQVSHGEASISPVNSD